MNALPRRPRRDAALAEWSALPVPRPPQTQEAAVNFAFDWPSLPGPARPRCCSCREMVVHQAAAIRHMDLAHPGWLDEWNAALRTEGIVA